MDFLFFPSKRARDGVSKISSTVLLIFGRVLVPVPVRWWPLPTGHWPLANGQYLPIAGSEVHRPTSATTTVDIARYLLQLHTRRAVDSCGRLLSGRGMLPACLLPVVACQWARHVIPLAATNQHTLSRVDATETLERHGPASGDLTSPCAHRSTGSVSRLRTPWTRHGLATSAARCMLLW